MVAALDHAGELGAVNIYKGQLAVLRNTEAAPMLREMQSHEEEHLGHMKRLVRRYGVYSVLGIVLIERCKINEHRVRPSALSPLWEAGGFILGAATASLGKEVSVFVEP